MIFQNSNLILIPLADPDYFIGLAEQENQVKYSRDALSKTLKDNGGEFWVVLDNKGSRMGVVGYFKFDGIYLFDGLRDKASPILGMVNGLAGSRMVIEHMFTKTKIIYACARKSSKAVIRLLKKLGFKDIDASPGLATVEDLMWFRMEG